MSGEVKIEQTTDNMTVFILPDGPGAQIRVQEGTQFLVRLKSNITTGYSWILDKETTPGKVRLIAEIDEDEEEEQGRPKAKLLGAPGYQTWKFKAQATGETTILLKMVRPWEKDVKPVKRYELKITVI